VAYLAAVNENHNILGLPTTASKRWFLRS